eukprot:3123205-Rhodomonas_salina.1
MRHPVVNFFRAHSCDSGCEFQLLKVHIREKFTKSGPTIDQTHTLKVEGRKSEVSDGNRLRQFLKQEKVAFKHLEVSDSIVVPCRYWTQVPGYACSPKKLAPVLNKSRMP